MIGNQPYTRLDTAFARFLSQRAKLDRAQKQTFEQLVAQLSNEQNQGHNCIQISDEDKALMLASGLAACSGSLPLIIEKNRLYTHRYWHYEYRLAMQISSMINRNPPIEYPDAVLDRYFAGQSDGIDWQREAAKMAVRQPFSIITGGPGTGKTTTVVKILAILQELAADRPLHIALAAPTGKAAMRLQESIASRIEALPCSGEIKKHIPETVSTLHRLLGAKPPSPYFYHNADKPLVYDLIVVDEASMVDLALMSKLFDAVKPGARLILLGDKDQLSSVESGAVLADLTSALPACTLELKTSHRFAGTIKILADAVNAQQAEIAWDILQGDDENCALLEQDLIAYIAARQTDYLQLLKTGADFREIYQAFSCFQVLCSNRHGEYGVAGINYHVEQKLSGQKHINLSGLWYAGRPVMVMQNNAALHLYNGDIGICMPDKEQDGKLMVFFQRTDGSVKRYLPARLPACETVFAMTIHKSQGSEFDDVLIVLPDMINPVLTKELLYTAITRAKKTVKLVTDQAIFMQAVQKKVERVTGLADKFRTGLNAAAICF